MEKLKYIRFLDRDDKGENFNISIQLTGGGAGIHLERGASAQEVIFQLRKLADILEQGAQMREG